MTPKMMARMVIFRMANTTATKMTTTEAFICQEMRCHQFNFLRGGKPRISRNVFFGLGPGWCSLTGIGVASSSAGVSNRRALF